MSALLKSGQVGNTGLKQLKLIREEVVRRWDGLGLLEGLEGHRKDTIAQLFENTASSLINEATATDNAGSFETVVFPIVRRVFSKLLANEIVSVQALNMPIGRIFYFIPKITTQANEPSFFPNVGDQTTYETRSLYDAYYEDNDPLFDRSKGTPTTVTATGSSVTLTSTGFTAAPITTSVCKRFLTLEVSGFNNGGASNDFPGKIIGPDGHEMDTEEFLASLKVISNSAISGCGVASGSTAFEANTPLEFRVVTQKYGRSIADRGANLSGVSFQNPCTNDGKVYLEVDLQSPSCIECDSVDGYVGALVTSATTFVVSWKRYADLEFESELNEVTFDLESVTIAVSERKLRAQWSPEMAQDVSAFHNIDAEAELTAILSEEIAAEIDREILRDLRTGAAWRLRWDYNGWRRFKAGQAPYTQKDWNQTLITAINQISAQIFKSTLRGGASWIVCSAEVSAVFDDLEYFHVSNAEPEQDQYNMGIEKIGSLQGRYKVYRDPYFPANKILLGHKGTSMLDTGYVYAPYVPLQLTPTIVNPFNYSLSRAIITRYAKKLINNRFYGVITVDGIRTFNIKELR